MRVFVTGAGGFVGRAVCRQLLDDGHQVTGLLLPGEANTLTEGCREERGDITEPVGLVGSLTGHDAVVHLAGVVGYGRDWEACRAVNVEGTRHMANAALQAGARRFVHMSSVAVYGRAVGVVLSEESAMRRIGDPYGDTKVEAEEVVRAIAGGGRLDLTVVRPVVIYGPGDRLFLPKLVENVRSGRARVIGRGDHPVDLVHVDDVARFMASLLADPRSVGETYNLADPGACTWVELLAVVARELGVRPPRGRLPYPVALGFAGVLEAASRFTGKPPRLTRYAVRVIGRRYAYVTVRAQRLGFQPTTPLSNGIVACLRASS